MHKYFLYFLFFSFNSIVFSQIDSSQSKLTITGYLEAYYCYDFLKPTTNNRPSFVYSHSRTNEFNLNLGFVKCNFENNISRANLALGTGTYMNANLANELGVLKNIFEGNVGIKLSKKHKVWVDAGVFSSHIGFESAIGKDCWNLTRSILADNSPYYESGVKITYESDSSKWLFSGMILNGWQHISRPKGNSAPAFGHQIQYKPNAKITLNSSSFVGSDTPDSNRLMRYFHNFYGIFSINNRFSLITGFDYGIQQKIKHGNEYNEWYSPVIILKTKLTDKSSLSIRGEYYYDKNGVIINTSTPNGFQTYGYSINFDYAIATNILWRIEGRALNSRDKIFNYGQKVINENYFVTTSLSINF